MKLARKAIQEKFEIESHKPNFVLVIHEKKQDTRLTLDELYACMCATD